MEKPNFNSHSAAELLKAMAHPVRLGILQKLCEGAQCVTDVQNMFTISQPNLSQHLANLKNANLVGSYANGSLRCYYLLRPKLVKRILNELSKPHPVEERSKESVAREVMKKRMAAV